MRRQRERAQTYVIAALAMTSLLGAVSMVIDAGLYFVIQHQLQNAADAAALDAVWFAPACINDSTGPWVQAGCQTSNPEPTAPGCAAPPASYPCTAAFDQVKANWGVALSLCAGPDLQAGTPGVGVDVSANPGLPPSNPLNVPTVVPYVVTLSCDAPHWFARVLPGIGPGSPLFKMHISVSAAAALGWLGDHGELVGGATPPTPTTPLVARLIV
jgi:Putative Flp pilus-assembly TadE/G-like